MSFHSLISDSVYRSDKRGSRPFPRATPANAQARRGAAMLLLKDLELGDLNSQLQIAANNVAVE